jgi:protein-L-isoaspartate O-methyltransferase
MFRAYPVNSILLALAFALAASALSVAQAPAPKSQTTKPATGEASPPAAGKTDEPAKLETATAPRYVFRRDHDPNGTGKFYMGREIAQVMGHQGADWLERPEREAEEEPEKMVEALGLKPGEHVADIGAGTGFIAKKMAQRVGAEGKVYGVDIQPEMLALMRMKMKKLGIDNVVPVQGTTTDPKLPAGKVDMIIMVDVYHEFSHPFEMTQNMLKGLKIGGRLVFIEYRKEDESVPIKLVHKMTEEQVKHEMSVHPVKHQKTIGILPRQHIIIFEKTGEPVPPPREDSPKPSGNSQKPVTEEDIPEEH